MPDEVRDGSVHPFPITFTKDGVGVDLQIDGATPATALVDGDLHVYTWKPVTGIVKREVDVSVELVKVDSVDAPGEMLWTPTAADTRCNTFTLVARDRSGDGAFDENRVRGFTHGRFDATDPDLNSRFNGT